MSVEIREDGKPCMQAKNRPVRLLQSANDQ
jgi:hypothetical protein